MWDESLQFINIDQAKSRGWRTFSEGDTGDIRWRRGDDRVLSSQQVAHRQGLET